MADQHHFDLLRQGAEVWNAWREKYPHIQPDLSYASFDEHEQLSYTNLSGANLAFSYLEYADLYQSNLSQAFVKGSNLGEADLGAADLSGTDLSDCYLCQTFFQNANLAGADLRGSNLQEADLQGANLTVARLQRANLSFANLSRANFSSALLERTTFGDVDLRSVEGLEKVEHLGPSLISTSTLSRSQGRIPEIFLRQAGLDNTSIAFAQSLPSKPDTYFTCLLSYSNSDQDLAQRLLADLRSQRVRCWSTSHSVGMNNDFHPEIAHIRTYDKLILLLSQDSIQSWWARMEAATACLMEARRNKLRLITLMLDHDMKPVSPSWVDEMFRSHCFYDFTRWKDAVEYWQAFARLLDTLQHEDHI